MNCNCFLFSFCAILFSVLYFSFYPHLSTHRLHVRLLPDLIYCVACAPPQPRKGPGVRLFTLPYPIAPLGRCRSPVSPSLPVARLSLNWDCMCGNEATWHVILWSSQRTLATANTHMPTSPLTQPSYSNCSAAASRYTRRTDTCFNFNQVLQLIDSIQCWVLAKVLKCICRSVNGKAVYRYISTICLCIYM